MSHHLSTGSQPQADGPSRPLYAPIKRRSFFMYAGATAGATALVLAGCSKDDNNNPQVTDVGSGDIGVLNYAYALEQLEAAFYARVLTGAYFTGSSITTAEKQIFTDLALHEKIHADFFRNALGSSAIKALTPDFSKVDFATRNGVLATAQAFEDLGVQAYNGAGRYITSAEKDILTAALNIHSVEARHSSHIRTMRRGGIAGVGQDGGGTGDLAPKSWVSLQENGGPAPTLTAPVYAGSAAASTAATKFAAEDNVSQGPAASPINVQTTTAAPTGLTVTAAAASEAFDEPLDADSVKIIARNFRSALGATLGLFN